MKYDKQLLIYFSDSKLWRDAVALVGISCPVCAQQESNGGALDIHKSKFNSHGESQIGFSGAKTLSHTVCVQAP